MSNTISWIYWDPDPTIFVLPFLNWPILWYGAFFALGFVVGFPVFVSILTRYFNSLPQFCLSNMKSEAILLADRLTIYVVVGTVLGARLGHFFFYEKPAKYMRDPLEIFRIWEGGLASHGAVIAIILAVMLFSYKNRKRFPQLNWIRILDFMAVPAAFAASCIRVGNFFNQEITGTLTQVPWAVIFGHPFDGTLPAPRHPVQLYEAFFYLLTFFFLWRLSYLSSFLKNQGRLLGIFLILVFSFRFLIEFFKTEQSHLLSSEFFLTMGQILSLPVILLGFCFCFFSKFLK